MKIAPFSPPFMRTVTGSDHARFPGKEISQVWRQIIKPIVLCALFSALLPAKAQTPALHPAASRKAVDALAQHLAVPRAHRHSLPSQSFAAVALSRDDAAKAKSLLWEDHASFIRSTRAAEMKAKLIELDGLKMKFESVSFGSPQVVPKSGRSLFISLHGGGGAPAHVNEGQWRNQVKLAHAYAPREGIYLAPRAPTNTWNLWHEAHIDRFFLRLIENLVVLEGVNPNRVYLLGYSAGGDGVYQLGPRMADRWAAAAMMAGHPNEASPLGLRNIGFALQVGAKDSAYNRNEMAREWGRRLDELRKADPEGYTHLAEIHQGKGHWMDLEDRKAIPWMEKFTRNPVPKKIVWRQDDVTHEEFYWLAVPEPKVGQEIIAERTGQTIDVQAEGAGSVFVRLNDEMLDLDQPVTIKRKGAATFDATVNRTIGMLFKTLETRADPNLMFSAEVVLRPGE
jgi:hypothetical protein